MKVELKELEGWKRSLDVEVPAEDVGRHFDALIEDYRRRMSVPGFRKGKAPVSVVRNSLGDSIEEEFLRRVVPEAYEDALKESAIQPISQAQIENLRYKQGEPLRFTAVFEVRPDIQPRDYKGLDFRQEVGEVADEDVERVLSDLRNRAADFSVVDGPAGPASIVVVDYDAHDESGKRLPEGRRKDFWLDLAGEGLLPEFRQGLEGGAAGQGRTLTVHYPAEFKNAALAGRSVRYDMKIKEIREKKLPELDDNLARGRFGAKDLEDLKTRIRLQMEGEERLAARERLEGAVVDAVLERNDFTPPESMVEELLENVVRRAREEMKEAPEEEIEKVRDAYRTAAARAAKRDLVWDAIARAESIEVTDAEVDAELGRVLDGSEAREARAREQAMRSPRNRARVHAALEERKVYDFLIQNGKVETVTLPRTRRIVTPGEA